MPWLAVTDDFAIGDIERGEERGAMALVIMRHGSRAPFLEWQSQWRAIEGLHLTLLVTAEDDRVFWRLKVKPHDNSQSPFS